MNFSCHSHGFGFSTECIFLRFCFQVLCIVKKIFLFNHSCIQKQLWILIIDCVGLLLLQKSDLYKQLKVQIQSCLRPLRSDVKNNRKYLPKHLPIEKYIVILHTDTLPRKVYLRFSFTSAASDKYANQLFMSSECIFLKVLLLGFLHYVVFECWTVGLLQQKKSDLYKKKIELVIKSTNTSLSQTRRKKTIENKSQTILL